MKLRFPLLLVSAFLSLSISADRTFTTCPGAWTVISGASMIDQSAGVNIHFTDPQPGEIGMIAAAGFRWVRMDLKWDATEVTRGAYDFSAYDRLLASLDEYKLRAYLILDYGNPLYTVDKAVRTEEARQAFARWAVAAAKHFAGRGVIWESFNEPNVPIFWPPRPNKSEYIAMALAVAQAFHANVPNEKLVGPATSGIDFDFLEACFKAGLLDYWSGVSVHPYRQDNPEDAANEYCRLRKLIAQYRPDISDRAGDRARISAKGIEDTEAGEPIPIISGEWGFSAAWPRLDEDKQGALLARELLTNVANGIPISIWYDWRDDGTDPREPEHHFGLVRNGFLSHERQVYQPKPAYLAVQALNDFFRGYGFEKRLALGSNADYILLFSNGTDQRIAAWTTSSTPHHVAVPLSAGSFSITNHLGGLIGSINSSEQTLTLDLSNTPIYVLREPSRQSQNHPRQSQNHPRQGMGQTTFVVIQRG